VIQIRSVAHGFQPILGIIAAISLLQPQKSGSYFFGQN
jgi:hypothetical protein